MARTSTKYQDEKALRAAVLAVAKEGWRAAAGRDMEDRDIAHFFDRKLPEHERMAIEVAQHLAAALTDAADFARKNREKADLRESGETRNLLSFLDNHLPFVVEGSFRASDGAPSLVNILEPTSGDWLIKLRGRVVALLTDHLRYWENLGLREPANTRTMAYASLLLHAEHEREFPSATRSEYATPAECARGITVAAVIQKEIHRIRAARQEVSRRAGDSAGG